ncbi:MAG: arsenic resistance N-acetyltransferase ArsN2 [Bacteroidia bacterium]
MPDSTTSIKLVKVSPKEMADFQQILTENDLPTDDLSQPHLWFFSYQDGIRIGTLGLEQYGSIGLLRSLSILPALHGQGLGHKVVAKLRAEILTFGLAELYLLTTTAEGFFQRAGFHTIERSAVPEPIKKTQQFSSICPSTAVVMQLLA